ncbi:hypothetical protein KP509_21G084100 [Ceratopteris richardii]|uniref:ZZ-type domain-containing protein n=1 Tax=Ceratopteris richardii TaxID=49495 RepID=A0A8T2SCL1_CERRI|nr:hypothetical protein KP509_21G084100 [Ceratopteris richardii]
MLRSLSMAGLGRVHKLALLQGSPYVSGDFTCHVCWEKGSGPVFHCPDCQFDVHASCVGGYGGSSSGLGGSHVAVSHFSHFEHPLMLKSHISSSDEVICDGCGDTHFGSNARIYRCSQCDFDLCALCVRAPRFLLHISHPHILALSDPEEVPRSSECSACKEPRRGMVYRCTSCNFDLHVSCSRLPVNPVHELHPDHPLTLLWHDEGDTLHSHYACDACGHVIQGWALGCSLCGFHLHGASCGQIMHVLPHSSSHFKHAEHKVHQRLHASSNMYFYNNRLQNPYNASRSLSLNTTRQYNSRPLFNRTYSSSSSLHNDPLSPHPYSPRSYSSSPIDRFYPINSPRNHYGDSWNGSHVSSTSIANALSSHLNPTNSRDAEALERVMSMLGHNGSTPYV